MPLRDDLRDDYELPSRSGPTGRMWVVMVAVPLIALLVWLVLPSTGWAVAVTMIIFMALIALGVWWAGSARAAKEPPGRHPQTPPSRQSH